jgi:hypothetical protein
MKYFFVGGGNYYIAISPPICQGEKNVYGKMAIFSGGNIYYITIFPPIQVRGKMAL